MALGTLAVDGWDVTFDTAMRDLGVLRLRPLPSRCTICSSPLITSVPTNFILFEAAL